MAHLFAERSSPLMQRSARILAAVIVAWGLAPAQAASPEQYQKAYGYALRCFVVMSAKDNSTSGKAAFDAAMKLAHLQGLSNRQIHADFNQATAEEAVKMARSPQYKQQLIDGCQKLGMAD